MAGTCRDIHEVCEVGDTEGLERLIKALVNKKNDDDSAPIHLAAEKGHKDIVKLLLDHGANIDVKDNDGETPIYRAAVKGHTETVKLLLDHGALSGLLIMYNY